MAPGSSLSSSLEPGVGGLADIVQAAIGLVYGVLGGWDLMLTIESFMIDLAPVSSVFWANVIQYATVEHCEKKHA
ncbi:uncharacterized protein BT62DRAFT_1012480 [Guyanagaster necrorhizus]|uniref:Uncharacterized protein n=1 Tax=Guyanagaster necrorhizus TaxID=856835 RepID=A0A9P8ALX8_9AGAR|nr:uncharacterized protein BT62DRAFT_1012480 [Guyanagaster necrorhizus MCA 3950]KAG7440703.1 hypothetical protein BT62DRAFT_1012480 [Guyanagaster necrorhizus MCA 3950]